MVKSGLNSLKEEDGICSLLEVRESQDRIIEKDKKYEQRDEVLLKEIFGAEVYVIDVILSNRIL